MRQFEKAVKNREPRAKQKSKSKTQTSAFLCALGGESLSALWDPFHGQAAKGRIPLIYPRKSGLSVVRHFRRLGGAGIPDGSLVSAYRRRYTWGSGE
jgi:hypothetical protein